MYKFDIIAIKDQVNKVVHCDSVEEFQREQKELFSQGCTYMSAYVFNDNGFVRRSDYARGKSGWIKIN